MLRKRPHFSGFQRMVPEGVKERRTITSAQMVYSSLLFSNWRQEIYSTSWLVSRGKMPVQGWVITFFSLQNRKSVWATSCIYYPLSPFSQRNSLTHSICLGESSVIEDGLDSDGSALEWAGGGGGGGGATYIYRVRSFSLFWSGICPSHICHTLVSLLEGTMWTAVR